MTCAYSSSGSLVAAGGLDNCCSVYALRQGAGQTQTEKCKLEVSLVHFPFRFRDGYDIVKMLVFIEVHTENYSGLT